MGDSEFRAVLPYIRRQTSKFLDGCHQAGECLPTAPEQGFQSACWLHRAEGDGERPIVFELHGGGFATGDARKGDSLREWVCRSFDVHVVGVEYRLAPENPFPAALDDVAATVRRVLDLPGLGADHSRVYLMGYSAGANLAAAYALRAQETGEPAPAGLILHYPCLDVADVPSVELVREEDLPVDKMSAFSAWYAGETPATDPLISPLRASDEALAGLCPCVLCPTEGDALFPQAERFSERLAALGADARWMPVAGVYHGYIEDAGNLACYEAISMAETLETRPAGFGCVAERALRQSLAELLGPALVTLPLPDTREEKRDD